MAIATSGATDDAKSAAVVVGFSAHFVVIQCAIAAADGLCLILVRKGKHYKNN